MEAVIESVLLESDVPDLVLARDAVGTLYLCALVSRDDEGDRFLATPISARRLGDFRSGAVDLRAVLTKSETGLYFDGRFRSVEERPTVQLEQIHDIPTDWWPDEGFLLTTFTGPVDNVEVVRQAVVKSAAVIECHFEPPEALSYPPRINADHLANGIHVFQALLKHAYKRRRAPMTPARKLQLGADGYIVQAFGFSQQSFCVHFQSKYHADLAGASSVGLAMETVDTLMEAIDATEERRLEILREHKGHVVGAFRNLMKFVSGESSPLQYQWADPAMHAAKSRRVTTFGAAAICAVLEERQELGSEEVRFDGNFIRVSTDQKRWTARDVNGRTRRGVVHAETPDLLHGTINEAQRYAFVCDEVLELKATGQQSPKLYLKELAVG